MRRSALGFFCFLSFTGLLAVPQIANAALSITNPANLGTYTTGTVQIPLQATGGTGALTWTVSSGTLPAGLAIRTDVPSFFAPATAGILGVATTADGGTPASFTLQVTDSSASPQTATLAVTMHITAENFKDLNTLPDAASGSPYSYTFTVLNGTSPAVSLSASSGPLPAGLNLAGSTISGTPTTPGNYNFTLQITDGADTISRSFNLNVAGPHITTAGATAGVLPNGTQNAAYNVPLAASGGAGGYTFMQTNGGFPFGVSMSSGGVISGTICLCAAPGRYAVSITVQDSASAFYQQQFSIDVLASSPVLPSITQTTFDDATVGNPYSNSVSVSGGVAPYTWTVTGLPAGMGFRTGAGTSSNVTPGDVEIWGIPQTVGLFNPVFTATDSSAGGMSVSVTIPLRVSALAYYRLSGGGIPITLGTAITPAYAIQVLGGTPGYSASVATGALPAGTSIGGSVTGASITGTPVENGNFNYRLTFTDSTTNTLTGSFNLSVNPTTVQIFSNPSLGTFATGGTGTTVNINLNACCVAAVNWSVVTGSTLPAGLTLGAATGLLSGSVATAGTYSFFLQATDASTASNYAIRRFTITFSPVSITTSSLAFGNVGTAYTPVNFAATGATGAVAWTVTSGFLPPGMTLTSGGLFSGTPTSTGQYNFMVQALDSNGNAAQRQYSISIYPAGGGPPVAITTPAALGTFVTGDTEIGLQATGGNGSFSWSVQAGSALPAGLSLRGDLTSSASSGAQAALIGVATTPGNYSFTLVATSGSQSVTRTFTMRVTALNLTDGNSLPPAYTGVPYTYTLTPLNNAAAVTYNLGTGGSLPAGLTLNGATGVISGTPTVSGFFNVQIGMNDGTDTVSFSLSLNVLNIHITTAAQLPNGTQGATYTVSLNSSGGTGPVTFTANGLPGGLTIASGNVITGTINSNAQPGLYSVSINATDGTNSTTQQFSLDVIGTSAQLTRLSNGPFSDAVVGRPYSAGVNVCCGGVAPFTWAVSGLPTGLFLRYAGGGTANTASGIPSSNITPGDAEIYGVAQTAGTSTLTFTVTDALGATTSQSYSFHVSAVDETAGTSNGPIGVAYSQRFRAIGGTPGYTATLVSGALPAGLTLSSTSTTGIAQAMISGTPIENGSFSFTLRFADSAGTANTLTRNYNIYIGTAGVSGNALQINTSSPLASMVTGTTQNVMLNACCATGYTWSLVGGALPAGLSLNAATGLISGTASPAGNYTFLLQVADSSNAANTARKQFTLQISSLQITTSSIPYGNLGSAYGGASGITLAATGGTGALTWSLAPGPQLPPGMSFSSAGVISGTPTSTGNYVPLFIVSDSAGNSASVTYGLNIYPAGGGPPLAITTPSNFGTYSIGEYSFELDATGGTGAYAWSLTSGSLPTGYALRTDTPAFFSASASAGIIGVGTTPGTYNFTLQVTSGAQTASRAFSVTITALNVKDASLPDGFVGQAYSTYQLTPLNVAAGHTATFTAAPAACTGSSTNCVPPGLTMAADGTISGTPSAGSAGAYSFNVAISDGTATVNRQFGINVYAIDITTAGVLPNAVQGSQYAPVTLTAVGGNGALIWTSNGLPNGFTLSSGGVLSASSAVTAAAGVYTLTVTATDTTAVSSVKRFALNVIGVPVALPELNPDGFMDDAVVGMPYDRGFSISQGGKAPFTCAASGLPAGMSVRTALTTENGGLTSGECELWGVASTAGTYNMAISVTDSNGVVVGNNFLLNVSVIAEDPGLSSGTIGIAYNRNLRVVGGTGPYSVLQTVLGQLPAGLTRAGFNVSGIPAENGGFSVTYKFGDSAGNTVIHTNPLSIGDGSGTIGINTQSNLGAQILNQSYTMTLNACCVPNPIAWSVAGGTLPNGLTLNGSSGVLSGTLSAAGTFTFLVKAMDSVNTTNTGYRQFTLVVTPIVSTTAPPAFGNVGSIYTITLTTTGATGAVTWTLNPGSYLPPGLTLSGNTITGTPTSSGQYFFSLTGTDTLGNTVAVSYQVNIYIAGGGPPLSMNTGPSFGPWPLGVETVQLSASGGTAPYTYSLTPGAAVVPGCRVQNGAPLPTSFPSSVTGGYLCLVNTPGTYNTSIRVTDSVGATFDRAITVNVSPLMLTNSNTLPLATMGTAYPAFTLTATGGAGAYTFAATGLPTGLTINSASGVISGTPTVSGNFNPNFTIGNASLTGTVSFNMQLIVNPYAITTGGTLPEGSVGSTYSQALSAAGCGAPCSWSTVNGSLPQNFSLNSGTGVLSTGTQTISGPFVTSFTIQVTGSNGTSQKTFTLIVPPNTITGLAVTGSITSTLQLGGVTNFGLSATGGTPPYTFSVTSGSLPPGISLQGPGDQIANLAPSTQYLAGRPTSTGTYTFGVQVTDSAAGTATKSFSVTVSPLSIQYTNLPLSGTSLILGSSYTQPILVVGGSGSYNSWVNQSPLQPGLTLNSTTGVISGTPTNTGSLSVPLQISDTSATPNVVVSSININVASSATATVTLGGPASGTLVPLGTTQSYNLNVSGGTGPYTISAVGALPAGVLLESGSTLGSAFGTGNYGMQVTFSTPGTYTFTVQAVDSSSPALTGAHTYTLVVPGYGGIATGNLNDGSVGVPYSQQLYAFDASAAWSLTPGSALPPGLGISASGVLSGTPTTAGTYSFSLNVGDGGTGTYNFTLHISALAITTSGQLPAASLNVPYGVAGAGVSLAATGGSGATTWSIPASSTGSLPGGLSLSGAGVISGTPNSNSGMGLFSFSATATNSGGSVTRQFSIYLGLQNPGNLDFPAGQTALADAILGQDYTVNLIPDGGVPGYTWTVAAGSTLPAGLNLLSGAALPFGQAQGVTLLAGLPTAAGQYTFNLVLTDSTATSITRTFTLNVTPLSVTVNNPPVARQGTAYSFQYEATGGTAPYTYSIAAASTGQSALPPGLNMSSTGLITGTPTGTGNFNFILTVTDSASPAHTLTTTTLTLPARTSLGYFIQRNNLNLTINQNFTINLGVNGSSAAYNWAVVAASPAVTAPFTDGLPPGVTLQNTGGGWVLAGNTTTAGFYQFMLQATNTALSSDVVRRTVTARVSPLSMTAPVQFGLFSPVLPSATMGSAYTYTFSIAGGTAPYSFAEAATAPLPKGMMLSSTGVLSGTPTQAGVYTIQPIVTDASGYTDISSSQTLTVTTATGKPALEGRNNVTISDASVGVPFTLALDQVVQGGVAPFTWSLAAASSLPPGLALLPGSNGLGTMLAGTPTAPGTYNFTLNVVDSVGQTYSLPAQGFHVSVLAPSPSFLPTAVRGTPYSVALSITGGTPPYSYQIPGGWTAPPGMTLGAGGLSGTPAYAGVFPIGVSVSDSATPANTLTKYFDFSVDDAAGEVPSLAVAPKPVNILFISGTATTSTPITISSSSGALPFNAALYGLAGTSLSAASGTTNTSVNLNFGSLAPGTYSGFLAAAASGAVNGADVTPVNITVLAPPPCTYTLSTNSTSSPIGGNSGIINISAGSGCTWTAAADPAATWITLTGATTGSGNGSVSYTTSANATGSPRSGNVTITGSTSSPVFTINQFAASCSFAISPSSISATAAGGSATISVISSGSSCNWTATGLSVAPTSGTGSGSVTVTIPANAGAASQVLTATIAGQTFTVNQSGVGCTYSLSSASALFAATGGAGSVSITAPATCPYTTVLGPSWISVTSGGAGTSTGSAQSLTYTVDANSTTQPRSGALTIGGQIFAITEQALACSVSVDTSTLGSPFAAAGGTGTIGVTTNGSNCSWNAASGSAFATVSPATGFGNGTINVTAASNAASTLSRSGSLTVSGQTISFAQAGTTCSYSLLASAGSVPSVGGLATATVIAPGACSWTAVSNAAWISVIASGSGGTADVSFTVAANASATPRTGTLTIAGQTFTVSEGGAPCSYTLASSSSGTLAAAGVAGSTVNYTASTGGCSPAVTSYAGWITATNAFTDPNGTMTYSVAANTSGSARSGNIQVGDKVFTVIQTGAACAYSLNSYGIYVNYLGANSNILGSADLGSCPNPTDGSTQPFISLGTLTGTPTLYQLPFTVAPFTSATKTVRKGIITFGGQLFYVKQSSF